MARSSHAAVSSAAASKEAAEFKKAVPEAAASKEAAELKKEFPNEDHTSFLWVYHEEPHRSRRREILAKHPEIAKLAGPETRTIWWVLGVVAIQIFMAYLFSEPGSGCSFSSGFGRVLNSRVLSGLIPIIQGVSRVFIACSRVLNGLSGGVLNSVINTVLSGFSRLGNSRVLNGKSGVVIAAFVVGATCNQNLFLAIHEMSHNLAHKSVRVNRYLSIVANLPIGIPFSAAFRPYHLDHHNYLGVNGVDTDLPTHLEMLLLQNVLGKAVFVSFQILFYAVRPLLVKAKPLGSTHLVNIAVQIAFDTLIIKYWGYTSFVYLILSSFFAGSWHPCAGHFLSEHYNILESSPKTRSDHETFSYYGPLNAVTYNVGYHNEHHDFPFVAWTRLPQIREIAPEFYDCIPHHDSWFLCMLRFVLDPNVGMWSRVKRNSR